ncbi:MAG: PH domain-containing protein [Bdellovibrionales bacterium]|nr:PH domain-containing protein [Bdellovibrionales bacterium]
MVAESGDVVVIAKTWRSEMKSVFMFLVLSIVSVYLSRTFPWSVIRGPLFSLFGVTVYMRLPLFWFIPAVTLGSAIIRIYDVRYVVDARGVECKTGILGLHQRVTRIRYEDIRSVEFEQTLLERFLDIGSVEVGTAATGELEIAFRGIAAPSEVQEMLQNERDKRQQAMRTQLGSAASSHVEALAS